MDMINFLNIKKLEKKNSLGVLAAHKNAIEDSASFDTPRSSQDAILRDDNG